LAGQQSQHGSMQGKSALLAAAAFYDLPMIVMTIDV